MDKLAFNYIIFPATFSTLKQIKMASHMFKEYTEAVVQSQQDAQISF